MTFIDKANATRAERRYWGDRELPTAKSDFFAVLTTPAPSGDGSVATIRLYGPIDSWGGMWGVCTQDIADVIDNLGDEVTQIILRVNSPGGEVFEGFAILNMLRAHKASVTAVVDGLAASAASVIVAGCDEAVMSPGSQMMIHNPRMLSMGNADDLRKDADILDTIAASLVEVYSGKAGDQDWTGLMSAETWLTAAQAVELGLADRMGVVADNNVVAAPNEQMDPDTDCEDDEPMDGAGTRFLQRMAAAHRPSAASAAESIRKESAMSETNTTPQVEADATPKVADATPAPVPRDEKDVRIEALEASLAEARANADAFAALKEKDRVRERDAFLDSMATKFSADQREAWAKRYDAAPDVIREVLASAPVVVNTNEAGYVAGAESQSDTSFEAAYDQYRRLAGLK